MKLVGPLSNALVLEIERRGHPLGHRFVELMAWPALPGTGRASADNGILA